MIIVSASSTRMPVLILPLNITYSVLRVTIDVLCYTLYAIGLYSEYAIRNTQYAIRDTCM